jgi:DNA-binding winged helix-turn-helix (wHTH) protein/TolB-like protein/Tfp pilus assembly protein PilF
LQEISKSPGLLPIPLEVKALYQFGKFRFDPVNHLLLSEEDPVSLTPKAFDVLLVLVQNGRRLTSKEELMQKVWPDSFVEEANLTVNISALRRLLGKTEDGHQFIETVPKKGYRFAAPVQEVSDGPRNGESSKDESSANSFFSLARQVENATANIPEAPLAPARTSARIQRTILAVALLLVVAVASGYFVFHGRVIPSQVQKHPHRLAVLPFQNLRTNTESDFLGFSLADAVITKLGYVRELSVRPSYAVQKYKAQIIEPQKIARELDVDTVLTGTFLREGDDLRITCQLVEINSQNILWKGAFDLKYEKLLTVQDRVASQIINGMELTLPPFEAERLKPEAPVSPLAYEYYLRGIDLYSSSDFPMAIRMFEKSAELAPSHALAWANLGKALTANASFQMGGVEQYQKAQRAFERALALQPDQIDAQIYMANMFTDTGKTEKAVPLLREALQSNPNHAEIHWELGYAYRFAGMLKESVEECERARQLDPSVKLTSSTLNTYLYLGQYDRFLQSLPKTDDLALIAFYRGFGQYYKKDSERAAREFDHAVELDRSLLQAQIGKALSFAIRHQVAQGLDTLEKVEAKINQRGVGDPEASYKIAQAYALLGDKPAALRVFRRSIETGFFSYPYFLTDPLLENLRKDSEFQQLMNKAKQRHEAFRKAFF